jgi:hypothetical protein
VLRSPCIVIAVLLGSVAVWGCGDKDLEKIQVPEGGVSLAYDLTPGATYEGHVSVGITRQLDVGIVEGTLKQNVDFDVVLRVQSRAAGADEAVVAASLRKIQFDWALPPEAPVSLDDFVQDAARKLEAQPFTFTVSPTGEVDALPSLPPNVGADFRVVLTTVFDALRAAFVELPGRPVQAGESWTEREESGRKGKLGRYRRGSTEVTVDGLFRHTERDEDVVKLLMDSERVDVVTTKSGRRETQRTGKRVALFSMRGYVAEIDEETRDFDPTQGMSFRKLRVTWNKTREGDATADEIGRAHV